MSIGLSGVPPDQLVLVLDKFLPGALIHSLKPTGIAG